MLDMGFEPQIRQIFENSKIPDRENRHTVMFSATFPLKIQELARKYLKSDIKITIGKIGSISNYIQQQIILVPEQEKFHKLITLLTSIQEENHHSHILIFVDRKFTVDKIESDLYQKRFRVVSIHGDRSQMERDEALGLFRSRQAAVMVATDVAQRGLDVPNVTHVINFSFPNDIEDYVHRIGRTGRVGNTGYAISFFNDANASLATPLINLLNDNKQDVPSFLSTMANRSGAFSSNGRYDRDRYSI
uniref:RNA helicase n=1 Tax=Myxobolus squamalis TaxID=59785 RepID=A0A6B2FX80_MYXSQ